MSARISAGASEVREFSTVVGAGGPGNFQPGIVDIHTDYGREPRRFGGLDSELADHSAAYHYRRIAGRDGSQVDRMDCNRYGLNHGSMGRDESVSGKR